MSLVEELSKREEDLLRQLKELEARRRPIEEELDEVRKLRSRHNGGESYRIPRRGRQPNWAQIARDHNITHWTPGERSGDSAHRAVRRHLSDVHRSVPHHCIYNQRQYP